MFWSVHFDTTAVSVEKHKLPCLFFINITDQLKTIFLSLIATSRYYL